jgi:hypothetical protein
MNEDVCSDQIAVFSNIITFDQVRSSMSLDESMSGHYSSQCRSRALEDGNRDRDQGREFCHRHLGTHDTVHPVMILTPGVTTVPTPRHATTGPIYGGPKSRIRRQKYLS